MVLHWFTLVTNYKNVRTTSPGKRLITTAKKTNIYCGREDGEEQMTTVVAKGVKSKFSKIGLSIQRC
jgi:hypothetical protein